MIRVVRDWLSDAAEPTAKLPGGAAIGKRYDAFMSEFPETCRKVHLDPDELTFNDYVVQVEEWLKANAWVPI